MSNQTIVEMLPPILTTEEVAQRHRTSVFTIWRRIKSGKLKAYKDGGEWRIKRESLNEYERGMINATLGEVANQ
ncbi:helix-turn-helix domain-containing protein [Cohnella sp.]|uniref:helix-turn-helix domain-containing protein n=1 Tax=Cohnella sp. TaxID=1883426 RepID=UPI0037049AA1